MYPRTPARMLAGGLYWTLIGGLWGGLIGLNSAPAQVVPGNTAEPAAAVRPTMGRWLVPAGTILPATPNMAVEFTSTDHQRPIHRVDLLMDGQFVKTLTNIAPAPGNLLKFTLNGHPLDYTVKPGATVSSIASEIAIRINATTPTTQVSAVANGNRIEVRSLGNPTNRPAPPGGPNPVGRSVSESAANNPAANLRPFFAISVAGNTGPLTTFVQASRSVVDESPVAGIKACTVRGKGLPGTWLRLDVTPVGGEPVTLAVTNTAAGDRLISLVQALAAQVNSNPGLQVSNGISADDVQAMGQESVHFNLAARRPGLAASRTTVRLTSSPGLVSDPSSASVLQDNLVELSPRTDFTIRAGLPTLACNFAVDTTSLTDGAHELTAVAYDEGESQTEIRITLPVEIRNRRR